MTAQRSSWFDILIEDFPAYLKSGEIRFHQHNSLTTKTFSDLVRITHSIKIACVQISSSWFSLNSLNQICVSRNENCKRFAFKYKIGIPITIVILKVRKTELAINHVD